MKLRLAFGALTALAIGPALPSLSPAAASDLGTLGQTWPIAEPDLLETMHARLLRAQQTGELDRMNQEFSARAQRKVMRPDPVPGLSHAQEPREWEYDPAITVANDIRDAKGNLIAARGARINPLNLVALPRNLAFIDGDSPEELAWAARQGNDAKAMIIMVKGSPFEQMKAQQRRFYFDQGGALTTKFGIRHTPALVRQRGDVLVVGEVVLKREAGV
ncbi:conjugal transfer pilus assembly protein TraW [Novosphingobium chloroacetimidivorans]|uniref:Conjugal transfer pilus assembly protein TraW n=1 Tax=Novosphingobium chloroacetimidivorans TaxID=1428314 RepID=A0A7W7KDM9_9SPHN|nr:type-F conjugative transfer system protein TraW [Novosphingobium chloroacetimidivorans]MBB4860535.1 conjugal transfer pilus assembly protein TraW [Novosphingobium chloroacetimidivorans]